MVEVNDDEVESADEQPISWYEQEPSDEEDYQIKEYDITASPNDFNILTMFNFIESRAVKIPGFQRNFVWDIKRASKLIESIIIGLPVPQVFLYEEAKNKFLVIDGQQRLMSIYYFVKGRFPKKEKRIQLRHIFDQIGTIPDDVLANDAYFTKFNLRLSEQIPNRPNKLNKLNYSTLDEYKTQFDLRTIRNVIIKQNSPEDDDSSIYEIFNRLNSGGVNLKPQEIRTSLYHSPFYEMLHKINLNKEWRELLGLSEPDLHMKDFEILLRGFAMFLDGANYKPSMTKFLNKFSKNSKKMSTELISSLEKMFLGFLNACSELPKKAFYGKSSGKFNISMFEAVFTATCKNIAPGEAIGMRKLDPGKLNALKEDAEFVQATLKSTADSSNVAARLDRAKQILF